MRQLCPPPPTWGSDILTPMSKTQRASEMACTKVSGSVQPLPTWKLGIRKENPPSLKRTIYSGGGRGAVKLVSPKYHHLSLSTVSPDTNDVDVQLSGPFQKQPAGFECGTKFNTEATDCLGIIGGNPQNQPRSKKRAANLHDIRITYGHGQNTKRTFGSDDDTLCFKPKMVTSV